MIDIRIFLLLAGLLGLSALQLPLYECASADAIQLSISQFGGLKEHPMDSREAVVCPTSIHDNTKTLEALFMTSSIFPGILLLLAINSLSRTSRRSYLAIAVIGCLQCTVALIAFYLMRDQIGGMGLGSYGVGLGGLLAIIGSNRALAATKKH